MLLITIPPLEPNRMKNYAKETVFLKSTVFVLTLFFSKTVVPPYHGPHPIQPYLPALPKTYNSFQIDYTVYYWLWSTARKCKWNDIRF